VSLLESSLQREPGPDRREVGGDRGSTPVGLVDRVAPAPAQRDERGGLDRLLDRPVTMAWSVVGRGMSVRWNVSGRFVAANIRPATSARAPSVLENRRRATPRI